MYQYCSYHMHISILSSIISLSCILMLVSARPSPLPPSPAPLGLWLARREELGYPLGVIPAPLAPADSASGGDGGAATATLPNTAELFVLEIGSEELPPDDVLSGMQQLRCAAAAATVRCALLLIAMFLFYFARACTCRLFCRAC